MAKYLGRRVPFVGVDKHARDYSVPVEGLSVRGVGVGLPGVGAGVVPTILRQLFFG
jgi:hypothetical protein